ncbi:sigma 54-interacting transcriptional regulator, partial [Candidatus Aminicenantes bacterium AC-334-E05]|nr:sigma 54-interacting transcriptional regulator [Candidatus Aminicenantes bacterium AC-334-E05]
AKKWFKISESLFDKINNPRGKTLARFNLGEVALWEGEWDFAEEIFKESLDFDRKTGNTWMIAYDLNSLGYIHFLKGDFELSEKELKESKSIFKKLKAIKEEADCCLKLGELYLEKRDYLTARKYLMNASENINKEKFSRLYIQLLLLRGLMGLNRGDKLKTKEIIEKCVKEAQEAGISSLIGKSLILKGKLLKDENRDHSKKCFERGIKAFRSLKSPFLVAESFIEFYSHFPELLKSPSGRNNILWAAQTLKKLKSFKYHFAEEVISKYLPEEIEVNEVKEEAANWITSSFSEIKDIDSPPDVLEQLLHLVVKKVPAQRAIIFLIDENGDVFYQKSNEKIIHTADISFSVIRKCVKERKALILNNIRSNPQYRENETVIIHNIDGIICVPISIEGNTIGVIYLDRVAGFKPFSNGDLEFLISISKPVSFIIKNSLEYKKLRDKIKEKYKYPLVTASRKMEKIFTIIDRVKDLDVPVMILGESGTGKELIARLIHSEGIRRDKEFIAINCSALPENLLEAELFGYVRGAFTGANRDKKGLIEEADGGTFFLDEIGDLPLILQAKLLRVLQEKEIRRLGENRTRSVDVRFICATNKNLDEEVRKGNFREDLYYRMRVVPIEIPPLRERKEDIPLLADYFVKKYGKQLGKEEVCFSPEAMDVFLNYNWPGNVRELENEIHRIMIFLGEENLIRKEHISSKILKETEGEIFRDFSKNLAKAKQEFEKRFILQALARNKYKKSKTAEELGLTRQGLLRLMKKHDIV